MMDTERIEALLMGHRDRRPLMRVTDYYKLIYQGVFGVGHIMGEGAWGWLEREAESLVVSEHPDEPLIEAISVDGSVVRVNLRPYLREGGSLTALFDSMRETALVEGSTEEFMEVWRVFLALVEEGRIETDPTDLEDIGVELREKGVIPHHHSDAYREAYSPAYRVVRRDTLNID
jgi:hypothetical protein